MKKIVGIIIAVMAIVLIGFSVSRIIQSYTPENENDYSEEISYLNNEVDFKMYLYGDNINFCKFANSVFDFAFPFYINKLFIYLQ